MYERIPDELQRFPSWVCWRYEDTEGPKPTKVPYSALTGALAKANDPQTWSSFAQALHAVRTTDWYSGIGFVLSESDPYTFIDLDDPYELGPTGQPKYGDPVEAMARQQEVFAQSKSYAERSISGKGLHIIVRGAVPSGRKRGGIEVYSNLRFMVMTGEVYRDAPIYEENEFANALHERIGGGKQAEQMFAGLEVAKYTNEQILQTAVNAANADKFKDLFYEANWQKYYQSQSEADFALVDMLAFYSENRAQVKELFLLSALGQREKSRADYRIGYMLNRCFDRMLPPIDIEGLNNKYNEYLEERAKVEAKQPEVKKLEQATTSASNPYSVPIGLVGEIAQFIYAQAPRQVAEIALTGALGLMAGIVGRAYNISGTGLNQYVLLLAPTGTGKEAIAKGIEKLMSAVIRTVPAATDFVGPGSIASQQALIKHMAKGAVSFVSVVGEFGIELKMMSSPFAPPHMQGLLKIMLDLYNKSGEGNVLRPSIYSDREKNTASVLAPNFSMIGESTPEKFYEALDEGMISSGMLPRFTSIEYRGDRPPLNVMHNSVQPSFELIEKLAVVCANALQLNSQNKAIHVTQTADAKKILDEFNTHCDLNINSSDREIRRHLWNRAHINAMKLAALVAVGCNPYNPEVTLEMANWAINLIVANVRNLLGRFDAGEIGIDNDETKQISKVVATIREYLNGAWKDISKYCDDSAMALHSNRIVPYSFVQRKLSAVSVFRKDKQGSTQAIKRALKTLCERGDIQEVPRSKLQTDFGTIAVSYAITHPKAFAG